MNARFVALVEVIGYLLSAIVGIAAVYSMFAKVEVLARAVGPIAPVVAPVASGKQAVLVGWMAVPGGEVKVGDAICSIATTPGDRARVLVGRHLRAAIEQFEAVAPIGDLIDRTRSLLSALPAPEAPETLTTTASGLLKRQTDPSRNEPAVAGAPFGLVYELGTLELTGPLEPANSDRVAVGQTARVMLPNYPNAVDGAVASVSEGPPKTVTLRFENAPEDVQKMLRDTLSTNEVYPAVPVRADIVVGRQSLFRYMFGKKS